MSSELHEYQKLLRLTRQAQANKITTRVVTVLGEKVNLRISSETAVSMVLCGTHEVVSCREIRRIKSK